MSDCSDCAKRKRRRLDTVRILAKKASQLTGESMQIYAYPDKTYGTLYHFEPEGFSNDKNIIEIVKWQTEKELRTSPPMEVVGSQN